jgi:hypothetical protein
MIFSYESNAKKYFQEKKMISLKIFYNEEHFTSKQTELLVQFAVWCESERSSDVLHAS